ncbi:HAMP domain-containing histidine kinase [Reichenbachiella agarivorans]|uniref:histidine kinase n=1 Tax=Reichenbachiella agarivorans TaxID=2979464 RepID=A0ABY6CU79_9BACT|nr:HAMP domain-containing sensor histidine kinase [Reichenbachiella agarivorans]UXP34038.1 HAMP domain-containing histidine kinase [Reichenbachiella agarivorans]
MKLVQKFVLFYLLLSLIVMSLGGVYYYVTFTQLIDKETDYELNGQVNQLAGLIKKDLPYDSLTDYRIDIKQLRDTVGIKESRSFADTMAYHHPSKAVIHHRKINKTLKIDGVWYRFKIFESVVEPLDTFYGTFKATAAVFLLLTILSVLYSLFISKWLLRPFHESLNKIKDFNVQNAVPIVTNVTHTYEFRKLNDFIENMTHRAVRDYINLKEFSENIAHEIRTPLAIASGNLDLLFQDKDLNEKQVEIISNAQGALNKVSRIQQSLITLSKIENEEFKRDKTINLSEMINLLKTEKEDIFELKNLEVSTSIAENVSIQNDPILLEILLSNLLQNAIKHNVENGFIHIKLTQEGFKISNSGDEPSSSTETLLGRFKKSSSNSDSIGLGLSIVNKICELSHYELSYMYQTDNKTHEVSILFPTSNFAQN